MSRSIRMELPSLAKEGWLRPLRKSREASLAGADGVVRSSHRLSEVERTTPAAPFKGRGHLLDGASTPPLPRRGALLDPKCCQENNTRICYTLARIAVISLAAVFTAGPRLMGLTAMPAAQTAGTPAQLATIKQYLVGCHNDRDQNRVGRSLGYHSVI